ncbi:protein C1orf43 homolog isoform X2 [Girardinichthys multiradiatus]|uniref:protein C1orf43 homolog isoform X2 n=1 Tax=Girardinichthys multiradiatus TaxID=208333 RepID=UPI001FAD595D|nr:protein C1orf43 homolog isoform X2 [Girardinichthys multiradiatus]
MPDDGFLSSVNVVLVMAYGSLVFVLLFIFVKRQIMRLAMKSRRGPHAPIGHNAPKELKQVIEAKLCQVQKIHFEPRLFSPADDRLTQRQQSGSDDYLYRMKALDAVRDTDFPFRELGGTPSAVTGKTFRTWLLQLRKSLDKDKHSSLIYTVLDGYNRARHGAEAFGEPEFIKYQEALSELASIVKSCSSTLSQHQSAAKDLTGTTEPTSPSSSTSSPTQTTYLTSAAQQRSKRPRNFLELKNFKDNYNTLDSTL